MKSERGEISIPTILTVIVFIILAGICIFMLTGENGLFVPKRYEENVNNNNTVNTQNETQNIENTTNNEALTVPMQ